MLFLSILSNNQKEFLKTEFKRRILIAYTIDFIILILVSLSFLLSIKFFLLKKISSIEKNTEVEKVKNIERTIKDKESVIKNFNNNIHFLNNIEKAHSDTADILYKLISSIPDNTKFYSLQLSLLNKELKVQGIASLREELLLLQTNLENNIFFYNIKFPLSNFTKKNNIDFYFSAGIVDN